MKHFITITQLGNMLEICEGSQELIQEKVETESACDFRPFFAQVEAYQKGGYEVDSVKVDNTDTGYFISGVLSRLEIL